MPTRKETWKAKSLHTRQIGYRCLQTIQAVSSKQQQNVSAPEPGGFGAWSVYVVRSQIRHYWTGIFFVLASAALFALSAAYSEERSALVGAGSALAGAAFTRVADLARERRAELAAADANRRRGLDETRRVAYMALLCQETNYYEIAATAINALVHHGTAVSFNEAADNVTAAVKGRRSRKAKTGRSWLQGQIDQITAQLTE
jgi:hypothetical protein